MVERKKEKRREVLSLTITSELVVISLTTVVHQPTLQVVTAKCIVFTLVMFDENYSAQLF